MFSNNDLVRRGKGNRKIKIKDQDPDLSTKRRRTPGDIIIGKLVAEMNKRRIDKKDVKFYSILLRNADQLRFMNMEVLAEVIMIYIKISPNKITTRNFNQKVIDPHLNNLLKNIDYDDYVDKPAFTKEDIIISAVRMQDEMFRYIIYLDKVYNENKSSVQKDIVYYEAEKDTEDLYEKYR